MVQEAIACGTLLMTVGTVLSLPATRLGKTVGPATVAAIGVVVLLTAGVVSPADMAASLAGLWRPFIAIASIMVTASVMARLGILDTFAAVMLGRGDQTVAAMFRSGFILGAATASIINNDAAVLLLTPLLVALVRSRYPQRPDLAVPFAFAVFSAAGVAPLITSNPMNLIVADYAGIGFNDYAVRMMPIALAGWLSAYFILRFIFRRALAAPALADDKTAAAPVLSRAGKQFVAIIAVTLGSYPLLSYAGGPVWAVAAAGAIAGVVLAWRHGVASPRQFAAAVSWEILIFLFCVFVIVIGLRNAGIADRMAAFYGAPGSLDLKLLLIGTTSALGSAVMNNHPMATLNALTIHGMPENIRHASILAALIGGDLGPRLLPMGSLAGLLWFDALRRQGVSVSLAQFVGIGAAVTLPTLALSLLLLIAMTRLG